MKKKIKTFYKLLFSVLIAVLILSRLNGQQPTAVLKTPNQPIFLSEVTNGLQTLEVFLTGKAPWNLTYTENGVERTVHGIRSSPYIIKPNQKNIANKTEVVYQIIRIEDVNAQNVSVGPQETVSYKISPSTRASGEGKASCTYTRPLGSVCWYVTQNGAGTQAGLSPGNAVSGVGFSDILSCLQDGDTIKVASGIYVPQISPSADTRARTFLIEYKVQLWGGYDNSFQEVNRNPRTNRTILTGNDFDTDAKYDPVTGSTIGAITNNLYHVLVWNVNSAVNPSSLEVIDGFIIRGGNANAALNSLPTSVGSANIYNYKGSAIYLSSGSLKLRNNKVHGNTALGFGSVYCAAGQLSSKYSVYQGNVNSTSASLYVDSLATMFSVVKDSIKINTGGGIYVHKKSNSVIDSTYFEKNLNAINGGAFCGRFTSISNSTFLQNVVSENGGAIYAVDSPSGIIKNNLFSKNYADFSGGAVHTLKGGILDSNIFTENESSDMGGAVSNFGINPIKVKNNLFHKNGYTYSGGGLYIDEAADDSVYLNTFTENQAKQGSAIHVARNNNAVFSMNTIVKNTQSASGVIFGAGHFFNNTIVGNSSGLFLERASVIGGNLMVGNDEFGGVDIEAYTIAPVSQGYNVYTEYTFNNNSLSLSGTSDIKILKTAIANIIPGTLTGSVFTPVLTSVPGHLSQVVAPKDKPNLLERIPVSLQTTWKLPKNSAGKYIDHTYGFLPISSMYYAGSVTVPICFRPNNRIWYVTQNGAGTKDGTSIANAASNIDNIKCLEDGDTVKVAEGTYHPQFIPLGYTADARNKTFYIDKKIALKGGYDNAFNEVSRDPKTFRTILSAGLTDSDSDYDVNGKPILPIANNLFHVLIYNVPTVGQSVIDGFVIRGANAVGASLNNGGGILFDGSALKLINNDIHGNSASNGGGLCFVNTQTQLVSENNYYRSNVATMGGGAVYSNTVTLNMSFYRDSLSHNTAANLGSAIQHLSGTLTVDRTQFVSNESSSVWGTIYASTISQTNLVRITDSRFFNNKAQIAGGVYSKTTLELFNNIFDDNTSDGRGGAVFSEGVNSKFDHNFFVNNKAITSGGALDISKYPPIITRNTFLNNSAGTQGGAVFNNVSGTQVDLKMNTFVNNTAPIGGAMSLRYVTGLFNNTIIGNISTDISSGAIDQSAGVVSSLGANIILGNKGGSRADIQGSVTSLGYNVYGLAATLSKGSDIRVPLNEISCFIPGSLTAGAAPFVPILTVVLASSSDLPFLKVVAPKETPRARAVINKVIPVNLPNWAYVKTGKYYDQYGSELETNTNFSSGSVSIINSCNRPYDGLTWFVSPNACGSGIDASQPADLAGLLASGCVADGDTVKVSEGTYRPEFIPEGYADNLRNKTFYIDKQITLKGGYNSVFNEATRNPKIFRTILSAGLTDTDTDYDVNGKPTLSIASNLHHVLAYKVTLPGQSVIDGFVIRGANAVGASLTSGGGILFDGSSLKLINNDIHGNNATFGGAVAIDNTPAQFVSENNRYRSNAAISHGGAFHGTLTSSVSFYRDSLSYNSGNDGGAINHRSGSLNIDQTQFVSNTGRGYGVVNASTTNNAELVLITRSRFLNNAAASGGALRSSNTMHLKNNFFENNSSTSVLGGGAVAAGGANSIYDNNLFINNRAVSGGAIHLGNTSPSPVITRNTFINNSATTNGGAISSAIVSSRAEYKMNTFVNNTATKGGAIYLDNLAAVFNNTIIGNTTTDINSAAFYINAGAVAFGANIVFGNKGGVNADIQGAISSLGYNVYGLSPALTGTFDKQISLAEIACLVPGALTAGAAPFVPNLTVVPGSEIQVVIPFNTPKRRVLLNNVIPANLPNWSYVDAGVYYDQYGTVLQPTANYSSGSVSNTAACTRPVDGRTWFVSPNACGLGIDALTPTDLASLLVSGCVLDGDTIKISEGIHRPEFIPNGFTTNEPRNKTFYIDKQITLKGGYNSVFDEVTRNPKVFKSVLSAGLTDTNNDYDVNGKATLPVTNNLFHVLVYNVPTVGQSVIDGLVIRGANTQGTLVVLPNLYHGAGVSFNGTNLKLVNSDLHANISNENGGAIAFANTAAQFISENNTYRSNYSKNVGGAVYTGVATNVSFYRDSMSFNSAGSDAGAIAFQTTGLMSINQVQFVSNSSLQFGGAVFAGSLSQNESVTVMQSRFINNTSTNDGGALYNRNPLELKDNIFEGNTSTRNGGAIFSDGKNSIYDQNLFHNNRSTGFSGGAMYLHTTTGSPLITRNTFTNNRSNVNGGAVFNNTGVRAEYKMNTFVNNTAASGSALYVANFASVFNNTIIGNTTTNTSSGALHRNTASASVLSIGGNVIVGNKGGASADFGGIGTFSSDGYNVYGLAASFVPTEYDIQESLTDLSCIFPGTLTGGLAPFVPILTAVPNKVTQVVVPIISLRSRAVLYHVSPAKLPLWSYVDAGKYYDQYGSELPAASVYNSGSVNVNFVCQRPVDGKTWFVSPNACGDGLSSISPTSLSGLLATGCVLDGDTIKASEGTYRPEFIPAGYDRNERNKTFYIDKLITLKGGYNSTFDESSRSPKIFRTILSAGLTDTDNDYNANGTATISVDDNLYHVLVYKVPAIGQSVIDGFVIRGGNTLGTPVAAPNSESGAGICFDGTNLKLINSDIHANQSNQNGGAIVFQNTIAQFVSENNSYRSNVAKGSGGAVVSGSAVNMSFNNDSMSFNTADVLGGAIHYISGTLTVNKSKFVNNQSLVWGGAIYASTFGATEVVSLTNSKFIDNKAISGGALYSNNAILIDSSYFDKNNANSTGGAIHYAGANGIVKNAVFVNNFTESNTVTHGGGAIFTTNTSNLNLKFNIFEKNSSKANGGAIQLGGSGLVSENSFVGNKAFKGGALHATSNSVNLKVVMNTFVANKTAEQGAAIFSQNVNPVYYNNTIIGNVADTIDAGIQGAGAFFAPNTVIGGNLIVGNGSSKDGVWDISGTVQSAGYNVYGLATTALTGTNERVVTSAEVLAVVPGIYSGLGFEIPYLPELTALNNFSKTVVVLPKLDFGILNRVPVAQYLPWNIPQNATNDYVDQAQHVLPSTETYFAGSVTSRSCKRPDDNKNWYVQKGGLGAKTGLNKADAASNLSDIEHCLLSQDSVHITEGVYVPTNRLGNQTNAAYTAYYIQADVVIRGGYKVDDNFVTNDPKLYVTVFDADLVADDTYDVDGALLNDDRLDNFFHVMLVKLISPFHELKMIGINFRGGYANSASQISIEAMPVHNDRGGAIYMLMGTAVVDQCNLYGNEATSRGSAIFLHDNSNLVISNSNVHHNLNSSTIHGIALNFVDILHSSFYKNGPVSGSNNSAVIFINNGALVAPSDLNVAYSSFMHNNMAAFYLSGLVADIYHSNIIGNLTATLESGGLQLNDGTVNFGANVFGGNRSLSDALNIDVSTLSGAANSLGYNVFVQPGLVSTLASDVSVLPANLAAIYGGSVDGFGRITVPLIGNTLGYSIFPNPSISASGIYPRAPMLTSQAWQADFAFGSALTDQAKKMLPTTVGSTYNSGSIYLENLKAVDDTTSAYTGRPVSIPILNNDLKGSCTNLVLAKVDTLAVNGSPKFGSVVWDNTDSTFIYTSNGNFVGFDSLTYYIECAGLRDTAVVRILVSRTQSDIYLACANTVDTLRMLPVDNVDYYWYTSPVGGVEEPTGNPSNNLVVTKDASSVQTWYAEPRSGRIIYDRVAVRFYLSQNCGLTIPTTCGLDGTILFKEDFGGNKKYDPNVSATGLAPGLMFYTHDVNLSSIGTYSLLKESNIRGGVWKDIEDHTYFNNPRKGYLMQVDGDARMIQLYTKQLNNVCKSRLLFSFWLANLDAQGTLGSPNITLVLEDVATNMEISRYRTGQVTATTWHQYGFNYTVPDNVQNIRLTIYSNVDSPTTGNDFAIDDIEIRLCAPKVELTIGGQVVEEDSICKDNTVQLTASYTDDGKFTADGGELVGRWYKSYTGNINEPADWTVLGSDIFPNPVTDPSLTTNLSFNVVETAYYRFVIANAGSIDKENCRAASNVTHVVMLNLPSKYPDLRIHLLPTPTRNIQLSSYLDTVNFVKVDWVPVGSSPAFAPGTANTTGQLNTADLGSGVSSYFYTIDNKCFTNIRAKAYIRTVNNVNVKLPAHTVVVCKDFGEALQMNQLLGLEAGVNWVADPNLDPYISDVISGQFAGARFFNAKAAYNGLPAAYDYLYLGVNTKRVVFEYTRSNAQTYQLILIITSQIL